MSDGALAARGAAVARRAAPGLFAAALPLATGLLLAAAFPPLDWHWLAWIALVPLAVELAQPRDCVGTYFGAYLGGLAFQLQNLDWIRTAYGGEGVSGPRATQWLAQGLCLALFWPLAVWLGRRLVCRASPPIAIALPIIWVAMEFSRERLWAIVDATGYPWSQLGTTQADQPLLVQVADLGGVYAVTATVACVNGALVDVGKWLATRPLDRAARCRAVVGLTIGALTLAATVVYGAWQLSRYNPRRGPVLALMPETGIGDLFDGRRNLARTRWASSVGPTTAGFDVGTAGPDLLLWSEAVYDLTVALPTSQTDHGSDVEVIAYQRLEDFARRAGVALVMGCDRAENTPTDAEERSKRFNSAVFIDADGRFGGCYDKVFLVPFSEFQPRHRPSFGHEGSGGCAHGTEYPVFMLAPRGDRPTCRFAASICYDSCFSRHFRRYMSNSIDFATPDFFVVASAERSDKTLCLQTAILRLVQFRAVECRRAVARNVSGGFSGIIDSCGRLVLATPAIEFDRPIMLGAIPLDARASLYVAWGDWMPIACCAALLAISLPPMRDGWRRFRGVDPQLPCPCAASPPAIVINALSSSRPIDVARNSMCPSP